MMTQDKITLFHVTTVSMTLRFLSGQIGYMQRKGWIVHVISSPDKALYQFATQEKVVAHGIPMSRQISPFRDLKALFVLWKTMRKIKPQIVHAHTPKGGLLGMLSAWLACVPVRIYHMHGLPMVTVSGYRRWLLYWSERLSCKLAAEVLCVSESLRDLALAENLCLAAKIKTLGRGSIDGVDVEGRFNPDKVTETTVSNIRDIHNIPSDAQVLGFVGRVVPDKGITELVAAWQILRDEFPRLYLLVVGPFESHTPLPADVEEVLRNDDRVCLTGYVTDTPPLYAVMDIFVFPSYREGFGVSLIEASAMRLPVVATNIPGCVNAVVDGLTGVLVSPYDCVALADKIRVYLSNPELRLARGLVGRKWVTDNFSPQEIWQAVFHEYSRLLEVRDTVKAEQY